MYGKSPEYKMDWDTVEDVLESGGQYGTASRHDGYGDSTDSDGYAATLETDRDRYAPGRSYDPITGYDPLQIRVVYKGCYRPAH